jgi:hypothetical protein
LWNWRRRRQEWIRIMSESEYSLKEHITTQRVEELTEKVAAREIKKGQVRRKVSQLGRGSSGSMHHLSGSGQATCQCWGHVGHRTILRRKSYFGHMPIFGEGSILRKDLTIGKKDLMLEHKKQVARKEDAKKKEK